MWSLIVISTSLLLLTQKIVTSTNGDVEFISDREKRAIDLNVIVRNILLKSATASNFKSTLIPSTQQPARTNPTTPLPITRTPFLFPLKLSLSPGSAFIPAKSQLYSASTTSTAGPAATSPSMSSSPSPSLQKIEDTSEVSQTSLSDVPSAQLEQQQNPQSQDQVGARPNLPPPPSPSQVPFSFNDVSGPQIQRIETPMPQSSPPQSPPLQLFAPHSPSSQSPPLLSLMSQSLPPPLLPQSVLPQSQTVQFLGPGALPPQSTQSQPQPQSQPAQLQSLTPQSLPPQLLIQSSLSQSPPSQSFESESLPSQSPQPQLSLPQIPLPQSPSPQSSPSRNEFPQFGMVLPVDDSSSINNKQDNKTIVDLPASLGRTVEEVGVSIPNVLRTDSSLSGQATPFNAATVPMYIFSPNGYIDSRSIAQFNTLEILQVPSHSNNLDYAFSVLDPEINYQYKFPSYDGYIRSSFEAPNYNYS